MRGSKSAVVVQIPQGLAELITVADERGVVKGERRRVEPLDFYAKRELITVAEYEAGKRLRENYEILVAGGFAHPRDSISCFPPPQRYGPGGIPERVLCAQKWFNAAVREMGKTLSGIAIWVCCQGGDAGAWAVKRGLKGRDAATKGIYELRLALGAIRDFT